MKFFAAPQASATIVASIKDVKLKIRLEVLSIYIMMFLDTINNLKFLWEQVGLQLLKI